MWRGGGGDNSPPPPPPPPPSGTAEGFWSGTTSSNRSVGGVVLDDGTYYFFYTGVNATGIGGFVQGNGTSLNGSFSSSNARDFNFEGLGVLSATISASYVARQSLNGTLTYAAPGGSVTFTTAFDSDYDTGPSLTALAGTYSGKVASGAGIENASVTILASGSFSGASFGGCNFSGSVAPRSIGNVYNISITFGPSPCLAAGQSYSGIAIYDPTDTALLAAAPNSSRTTGVLFVGAKP